MLITIRYQLRQSAAADEFEKWIEQFDMPLVLSSEGIRDFAVARIDGSDRTYVEALRVSSRAAWDELARPDVNPEHKAQFDQFVDPDSVEIVYAQELGGQAI